MRPPLEHAAVLALLLASPVPAASGDVTQVARLVARARLQDDSHGASVFTADDRAVVGAPRYDVAGVAHVGAAHVYLRDGDAWIADGLLLADDGVQGSEFGASVGLSGETAIVGAPFDSGNGAAYVFVHTGSGWVQQAKLVPTDGLTDRFGRAVAVRGDIAMVGAPVTYHGDPALGVVYVFQRSGTTWSEVDVLVPSVPDAHFFGDALSLDAGRVAVGSLFHGPTNAGAVFTFVPQGTAWVEEQMLLDPVPEANNGFGASVSLRGGTLVAGSPADDTAAGPGAGSADVFTFDGSTWSHLQALVPLGSTALDHFGHSVSLSGTTILVGLDPEDPSQGSAYAFRYSNGNWTQLAELAPEPHQADFGYAVSHAGLWAVIGAPTFGGVGSAATWKRSGFSWSRGPELVAIDAGVWDELGSSLAALSDVVVSGAPQDDHSGLTGAGSVQVWREGPDGTWTWDQRLVASDAEVQDGFGTSVALAGPPALRRLLVGATGDDDGGALAGAVYRWESLTGGAWQEVAKITASDAAPFALFGCSVAVEEDTLRFVVGARGDGDAAGPSSGAVYAFDESGAEEAKLVAPDAAGDDHFGYGVAYSEGTVVVGSPWDDHAGGGDAGSAYVWVRGAGGAWVQQAKLVAGDASTLDAFGRSVAVFGDTVAVGAPLHDEPGAVDTGAVYVFERSGTTWSERAELVPADAQAGDEFGNRIVLRGDALLVGGPLDDHSGRVDAGSARLFRRAGPVWQEQAALVGPNAADDDYCGWSVALTGDGTAAVGVPWDDSLGVENAGSIAALDYAFLGVQSCFGVGCPCGNDDSTAGCATSTGSGALLDGSGSASVSAAVLDLVASGVPTFSQGLVYMGDAVVSNAFFDGKQCALGTTLRFLDSIQSSGASGTMTYGDAIGSSGGLITPGSTWHFHGWFRDTAGPCGTGSNLTNLYSVTFGP